MGHPDEGLIRAFRDGEISGGEGGIGAHLATCPQCAQLAADQDAALAVLANALPILDVAPPLDRARARFLRTQTRERNSWRWVRQGLPKAASFAVLLTAGAAAALPGSPVRSWVVRGWETITGTGVVTADSKPSMPAAPTAESEGAEEPEMVGATIPVARGGISLQIGELAEGAEVRVLLVDGDQAGVFGGEGTRFRTEDGVLEALGAPGNITVEIPRGAPSVEMLVNGVTYLRMTGGALDLPGPVVEQGPDLIRFRIPSTEPTPEP